MPDYDHIIVQHTPKCAGMSLRLALQIAFGRQNCAWLHPDHVANEPPALVFGGHFAASRYRHVRNAVRVATIRHPVSRAISHYCFWTSPVDREHASPLRQRVLREGMSVYRFARLAYVRHLYHQMFFSDVGPEFFNLILGQEHFERGVAHLSEMIGLPLPIISDNTMARVDADSAARQHEMQADDRLRDRLTEILTAEVRHYEKVLSWPGAQRASSPV